MIEQRYQSDITICERFNPDLNPIDVPIDERYYQSGIPICERF